MKKIATILLTASAILGVTTIGATPASAAITCGVC